MTTSTETDDTRGLKHTLSALANGTLTYAGVGVFGGLLALYGFSLSSAGPAMFWGWPVTMITVGALVLTFSQMASHFPFAGSMYQWPSQLAGRRIGWWVGWIYAFALFPLMTAYYAVLPVIVRPLFGWEDTFSVNRNIIVFAMVFALVWNMFSVGILGKLSELGMIVEILVSLGIIIAVFVVGPKHFGVLADTSTVVTAADGSSVVEQLNFGGWVPALLAGGIFVSYWVLYTFENGGTLGEETLDAARNAPKAILGAFGFASICGLLFLGMLTVSLPDVGASMLSGTPAEDAIAANLPAWAVKVFLAVLAEGALIATSTMFTGATRHIFGMARDRQFPLSRVWTRTTRAGVPWAAALLVAVVSMVPVMIFTTNTASIVGGATAAMYVSYFLVTVIFLVAVLRGWPKERAPFSLRRWTLPVAILAVLGTGTTALNLLWPRATTNPTYDQIQGEATSSLLRHIPMGWYLVGIPLLIGILYFGLWQRKVDTSLDGAEQPLVEDDHEEWLRNRQPTA